jgi:hypothetical protein
MTETINLGRNSALIALKSWFKAGCPSQVPVSDSPAGLILRGYVYLLGMANHGVDLRRSRRLLLQSGEADGCEILMNVAATASLSGKQPEMGPVALAWAKEAIAKGSTKAYAIRALFALSPRKDTLSLADLWKETEGNPPAVAAVARTLHTLRHPEAESWVRRAQEMEEVMPFELGFYQKQNGEGSRPMIVKGAQAGEVACCRQLLQEDLDLPGEDRAAYARAGAHQVDPSCAYYHAIELLKSGISDDVHFLLLTTLMAPAVPEADSAVEELQKVMPAWFDGQDQLRAPRGEFLTWLYRRLSTVTYEPSLAIFVDQWQRMVFHSHAPKIN